MCRKRERERKKDLVCRKKERKKERVSERERERREKYKEILIITKKVDKILFFK